MLCESASLPARVAPRLRGATLMQLHVVGFARIIAVDAVMVIAAGNGVVKEDIAAKLEAHGAYLPGQ